MENVVVHPNYSSGKPKSFNIAMIKLEESLNATRFSPLLLKGLTSNSSYVLYDSIPLNVTVFSPQFCGSDFPQAFCARFESMEPNCFSTPSAPLVSESGGNISFNGFLISEDGCEEEPFSVYYHSIGDFTEWIQKVSSSNLTSKVSILTMMSAVWLSLKFIV
jgi:hypothetical protein